MNKYDIIISPMLTEKSYDGIQAKRYTFKVDKRARSKSRSRTSSGSRSRKSTPPTMTARRSAWADMKA